MSRGSSSIRMLVMIAQLLVAGAATVQVLVDATDLNLGEFISDYETRCATRFNGPGDPKEGMPSVSAGNGDVTATYDPSDGTLVVYKWTYKDGQGQQCDKTSTFRHEMMHVLNLTHSDGGAAATGTLSGGVVTFGGITETNCGQIDHRAGPPNYDSNGNPSTPILLDTGGTYGVETTGPEDPVLFDMEADGTPRAMTWTGPGRGQAFLVIDLSGNGAIDNGAELFGSGTFLVGAGIQALH